MAKIYASRIKAGKMDISMVPQRWKDEVLSLLAASEV